jgi:outer membrane murein-binding lipoprotein Lpp
MVILANIAQQRSANVSYDDIHEAFRNDREVGLKQPAGKVPNDQIEQSAPSASQEYEERIERLVKERDQLRKQLQATKAELAKAQEALADGQKAEAATEVIPIEELPPLDSKQRVAMDNKADHQGESQSDPARIPTLEDQLKNLGEKPWWQVWRR